MHLIRRSLPCSHANSSWLAVVFSPAGEGMRAVTLAVGIHNCAAIQRSSPETDLIPPLSYSQGRLKPARDGWRILIYVGRQRRACRALARLHFGCHKGNYHSIILTPVGR
ncbi:hypothetical protein V2G26_015261 [Clonostachys chloroleuca]